MISVIMLSVDVLSAIMPTLMAPLTIGSTNLKRNYVLNGTIGKQLSFSILIQTKPFLNLKNLEIQEFLVLINVPLKTTSVITLCSH